MIGKTENGAWVVEKPTGENQTSSTTSDVQGNEDEKGKWIVVSDARIINFNFHVLYKTKYKGNTEAKKKSPRENLIRREKKNISRKHISRFAFVFSS